MAVQMDTKMVACLVGLSVVLSAASTAEHWADQTVALLEATMVASRAETWVAQTDTWMVEYSAADSVVSLVALTVAMKAVTMDACWVEWKAASMARTWVG